MTERSLYEAELESGMDCLIAQMNAMYGLDSPRGNWEERRSRDEKLREELIAALKDIVRCRKISEMYLETGLDGIGYRVRMHVSDERLEHFLVHCTCGEHSR